MATNSTTTTTSNINTNTNPTANNHQNTNSSNQSNHQDILSFTNPHPVQQHEIQFDLSQRRKGVCKFFNSQKGFGFINDERPEELGNQEVFVHYTSIGSKGGFRSLGEGEEVEYVVTPGQKGFQATEVTGPAGRAVVGDVKSKLPKTPTFVPYPMGIMPGTYAIAGAGSPYMQPDPYMSTGAFGSPYGGQVFYVPSAVGVIPGAHSPNPPYPNVSSPHPSTRSPTVPFTHHQHTPMAMSISPQPASNGFGFTSPSMAYGFGAPVNASTLTAGVGASNNTSGTELRSPSGLVSTAGFGTGPSNQSPFSNQNPNHGLGLGSDSNSIINSTGDHLHHRSSTAGSQLSHQHQPLTGFSNPSSLLYTTTTANGIQINHQ
ncbi:hypothetical protein O181_080340 [Austropuccinia psidii MF-1]|uniref:CSD domain-containing protein n=1 Tax=Austropuccinia psidii MF-1 TaxID=1389203 RepID=A0A9Q3IIS9_9BASI|nr:hypothetical protein [Austropuccinia psidii MF-1]